MYLLPLIQRDIEHMLQIKMARKRKGEVGFSWTDDELQFPLESSLDFKSKCEFQGESWESKRSKYENILDITLKYPVDQEKYLNKEKRNKGQNVAKLKTIKKGYRKACDNGRKRWWQNCVYFLRTLWKSLGRGSLANLILLTAHYKVSFRQQLSSINFLIYLLYSLRPLKMTNKNLRKVLKSVPHLKK